MQQALINELTKQGVEITEIMIQRMKKAEEEWEEINHQQSLHWWANVWKYFHNLHTRKSRNNTLNGRET